MKTTSDTPTLTRTTKSAKVAWLLEHQWTWEGYPKHGINRANRIFRAMQDFGLFSPRSQCNPLTISRLVEDARAAQKLNSTTENHPTNSDPLNRALAGTYAK